MFGFIEDTINDDSVEKSLFESGDPCFLRTTSWSQNFLFFCIWSSGAISWCLQDAISTILCNKIVSFFKSHPNGLQHNRLLHAHCTTNIIKSLIEAWPGILRKLWTIACPQEKRSMCKKQNKTQTEAGGHAKFSFSHHINGLITVCLHIRSEEKRTPDVSEGDYMEISVLWTCRWMSGFLIIL